MLKTEQLLREAGKERRPSWLSPLAARGRPSVRPIPVPLRGCPETLCGITKLSQHEGQGLTRRNRKGEVFRCIACDHKGDADFIGAQNVLTKTLAALGRVLSPGQKRHINKMFPDSETVLGFN